MRCSEKTLALPYSYDIVRRCKRARRGRRKRTCWSASGRVPLQRSTAFAHRSFLKSSRFLLSTCRRTHSAIGCLALGGAMQPVCYCCRHPHDSAFPRCVGGLWNPRGWRYRSFAQPQLYCAPQVGAQVGAIHGARGATFQPIVAIRTIFGSETGRWPSGAIGPRFLAGEASTRKSRVFRVRWPAS